MAGAPLVEGDRVRRMEQAHLAEAWRLHAAGQAAGAQIHEAFVRELRGLREELER